MPTIVVKRISSSKTITASCHPPGHTKPGHSGGGGGGVVWGKGCGKKPPSLKGVAQRPLDGENRKQAGMLCVMGTL